PPVVKPLQDEFCRAPCPSARITPLPVLRSVHISGSTDIFDRDSAPPRIRWTLMCSHGLDLRHCAVQRVAISGPAGRAASCPAVSPEQLIVVRGAAMA